MELKYLNPWIECMELKSKKSKIECMELDRKIHELNVWIWKKKNSRNWVCEMGI
jgi:hypothetical protein